MMVMLEMPYAFSGAAGQGIVRYIGFEFGMPLMFCQRQCCG